MDTPNGGGLSPEERALVPAGAGGGYVPPPPPPPEEDDDDEGMLRMSFLEHLEEMRNRIIRALMGFGVAFLLCIVFCYQLWDFVRAPAVDALNKIGAKPPELGDQRTDGSSFPSYGCRCRWYLRCFWLRPGCSIRYGLLSRPACIKRKNAWRFLSSSARRGCSFWAAVSRISWRSAMASRSSWASDFRNGVTPLVTITHYFDLFVNVMLGVALVFELPVAIFFLTVLHLASPRFLLRHSRYAILAIVIVAAIITPTPDFFNLMLFAVPMVLLYFVGVFASYCW